jgi:hypothetical protein
MLLTIPDQSVSTRALDRNRGGCEGHRLQPRRTQGRHRSRLSSSAQIKERAVLSISYLRSASSSRWNTSRPKRGVQSGRLLDCDIGKSGKDRCQMVVHGFSAVGSRVRVRLCSDTSAFAPPTNTCFWAADPRTSDLVDSGACRTGIAWGFWAASAAHAQEKDFLGARAVLC